jgi:hypothetical protein
MAVPLYRSRIIPAFAVLGALSGGIAAIVWPLLVVPGVFYGPSTDTISLSPAVSFAIALAAGLYVTVTQRIAPIAAMMAATFLGWWIAVEVAAYPSVSLDNTGIGVLHWLACGLAGSLVLGVTGAIVGLYDRNLANIAEIGLVGALVVLVSLWVPQINFWLLLVTWQAAVGAAIAHAIVRSQQSTAVLAEPRAASN